MYGARQADGGGVHALEQLLGDEPRNRPGRIRIDGRIPRGAQAIGTRQGLENLPFFVRQLGDVLRADLDLVEEGPARGKGRHDLGRDEDVAVGQAALLELAGDVRIKVFYFFEFSSAARDGFDFRKLPCSAVHERPRDRSAQ